MNASFPEALLLAAALLAGAAAAEAAPAAVEPFDAAAWQALRATAAQPTVVVFTATYCAYCPAVVEQMAREIRQRKMKASLAVVVIDAEPGRAAARALAREPHYRDADRLFAFAGRAAVLQHAVNPQWRGITPYVAMLAPQAAPRWVTGAPAAADVEAWAAGAAALR